MQSRQKIYVAKSRGKGKGVFAARNIKKGDVIDVCPAIVLNEKESSIGIKTDLWRYFYNWGDNSEKRALVLGYGSLYNHSFEPNAYWKRNTKDKTIIFYADKDISKDEEITHNYSGHGYLTPKWMMKECKNGEKKWILLKPKK